MYISTTTRYSEKVKKIKVENSEVNKWSTSVTCEKQICYKKVYIENLLVINNCKYICRLRTLMKKIRPTPFISAISEI